MSRVLYFAYGSNLDPLRLHRRVPGARLLGRAVLRGHRLCFHKRGRDGSGKCDAAPARPGDLVHGVLWALPRRHLRALDRAEDLGRGYDRVPVRVACRGRMRTAFTYQARAEAIDPKLVPFDWYLGWVLRGARHQGLPRRYVRALTGTSVIRDGSHARRLRNLGLMDGG